MSKFVFNADSLAQPGKKTLVASAAMNVDQNSEKLATWFGKHGRTPTTSLPADIRQELADLLAEEEKLSAELKALLR